MNFLTYHNKINKKFIIVIILTIFISLFFVITLINSYNISSTSTFNELSYYDELNSLITSINGINSSLSSSSRDNDFNVNDTINNLNSSITQLDSIQNALKKLKYDDTTFSIISESLNDCINSTKELYSYCLQCLSSTKKDPINNITSNIEMLKNNCSDKYIELSSYKFTLSFTESMNYFLGDIISYLSALNKITLEAELKSNKIRDFKKNIASSIDDFASIIEDLQPAIDKIREDHRSLDVILNDLSEKETRFTSIKNTICHISIPESCMSWYSSFNDSLTLYSTYLSALRTAIIYEKSASSYESNKEAIDKNYSNAYLKYNDVLDSFNSTKKSFKSL